MRQTRVEISENVVKAAAMPALPLIMLLPMDMVCSQEYLFLDIKSKSKVLAINIRFKKETSSLKWLTKFSLVFHSTNNEVGC